MKRFVAVVALLAWTVGVVYLVIHLLPGGRGERRVALVIGNAAYRSMPRLPSARNDAEDVSKSLRELGFETVLATDLDRAGMSEALSRFTNTVLGADIAIVYYTGHGLQFAGTGYLLPTEARLSVVADVNRSALLPIDEVVDALQGARGARVLVLDAAHSNSAEDDLKRRLTSAPGANRDALSTRGLGRVAAGKGLIVTYAAQLGDVAADGSGRNTPFAIAFLRHIGSTDVELKQTFGRIRDEVARATGGRQRPELAIAVEGEFKLKTASAPPEPLQAPGPGAASVPAEAAEAERAWAGAKDSPSQLLLEDFIRRFGDSRYAVQARARLEELKKGHDKAQERGQEKAQDGGQVAVAAPGSPSTPAPTVGQQLAAGPMVPPSAPCGGSVATLVSLASRTVAPLSAAEECGLKPKDLFKECEKCPEMIVAPAGSFTMGSPEAEKERRPAEGPPHLVRFARPFAVGRYAVTFDEWDACVAEGGCSGYRPPDQGYGRGRRPVINVSFEDAKTYAAWLSRKTGKTYRLMSEAEREYVARAGTSTPFWWGAAIAPSQANYDGRYVYGGGVAGENRQRTLPVDALPANPFGLYQVHGNVWEWVEDCYNATYAGAPADGSAWASGDCNRHVLRGGAWNYAPSSLRAAVRLPSAPIERRSYFGIRLARSL
jgi:formylglycine-generating enzyme required for sulfatase activity